MRPLYRAGQRDTCTVRPPTNVSRSKFSPLKLYPFLVTVLKGKKQQLTDIVSLRKNSEYQTIVLTSYESQPEVLNGRFPVSVFSILPLCRAFRVAAHRN